MKTETYELAAEKPVCHAVHHVQDFSTDATVDVLEEAKKIAQLPGVTNVSVDTGWAPTFNPVIKVTCQTLDDKTETINVAMGGWLVIRRTPHRHPLDDGICWRMDLSGRIMFHSEAEFRERYSLTSGA